MSAPASPALGFCPTCRSHRTTALAGGLCLVCLAAALNDDRGIARSADEGLPPSPRGLEYLATLGRGGMGQVFLAYQARLQRYVAVKQIAGTWQTHPLARERFLREARATARLSHPGIVPVLEIGSEDNVLWYTMEFLEGGDLAALLTRRGGSLPWPEAVAIVAQAAAAIEYAHRAGIAHRDLKPSNVLLDEQGHPKISDFGLAWLAAADGDTLTRTGEILGTPSYLAPEALATPPHADARPGDIYALCALLFHLIAGRPPFLAESPLQVLHSIAREPAPRLRAIAPTAGVPQWVDDVVAHGLEKRPESRIPSAAVLASALELGRGTGGRWRRYRRSVLITGAAAALIGGVAVISSVWPASTALSSPVSADEPLVAILPLDASTDDASTAALAAGVQDELADTLLRISDVRVLTASSVRAAGLGTGNVRDAQAKLGAGVVLTGSVRRSEGVMRFSVQLLDARDGSVRWTGRYDRRETDLFNLQTDIATAVALHLQGQLRPGTNERTTGTSSRHPRAQRLFFEARALAAASRQPEIDLVRAEEMLAEAAVLDPAFALALAHRSLIATRLYNWGHDRSEQRLALGLEAAQQALRLNAELPEARIALALYYYRRSRDHESARMHIDRALQLAPHNPVVLSAAANLARRSGNFAQAAEHFGAALPLDPVNGILAYNTADTFLRLRQYDTADAVLTRSLARLPGHVALTKLRGDLHLLWRGDLGPMREDLEKRERHEPTPEIYLMHRIDWLLLEGRSAEALATLQGSQLDVLEGQSIYLNRDGYEALLLAIDGQPDAAAAAAQRGYQRLLPELERRPDDARLVFHAAQLLVLRGDLNTGEALARRTLTPGDPAAVDAFDRGFYLVSFAVLQALAGKDDDARETLRLALHEPAQLSPHYIRHHPVLSRVIDRVGQL